MSSLMIKRSFATLTSSHGSGNNGGRWSLKFDLIPIPMYCLGGVMALTLTFACHTGFQQLVRSPTVHVNKHRRETMPEVSDPDRTLNCAVKFFNGSFSRKVALIQYNKTTRLIPFTTPRREAETLKTVGVDPTLR
ncbi:hypothetical protein PIB30_027418 [Stylosanthes scabra]|uniref:Uncharacterized protein n=1 Tax=Stylosanthes scabra TaxID=79078 RepID=A0ABU6WBM3_9FABA|nr:hypothetical protein [Stylosanthes scabra]